LYLHIIKQILFRQYVIIYKEIEKKLVKLYNDLNVTFMI